MTTQEFWKLTPARFKALLERRWQEFRRQIFASGVIAAQQWNMQLGEGQENKLRTPFDYVPGVKKEATDERSRLLANITTYFSTLRDVDEEKAEQIRVKVVERLKKAGHEDAEELIDNIYVAWARQRKKKETG